MENMKEEVKASEETKKRGRPKKSQDVSFQEKENTMRDLENKIKDLTEKIAMVTSSPKTTKEDSSQVMPSIYSIDPATQRETERTQIKLNREKYEKKKTWIELRGRKIVQRTSIHYEYPPGVDSRYPNGGIEKGQDYTLYMRKAEDHELRKGNVELDPEQVNKVTKEVNERERLKRERQ